MTQTLKIVTAAVIKMGVVILQHNMAELQITFRMLKFSRQLSMAFEPSHSEFKSNIYIRYIFLVLA